MATEFIAGMFRLTCPRLQESAQPACRLGALASPAGLTRNSVDGARQTVCSRPEGRRRRGTGGQHGLPPGVSWAPRPPCRCRLLRTCHRSGSAVAEAALAADPGPVHAGRDRQAETRVLVVERQVERDDLVPDLVPARLGKPAGDVAHHLGSLLRLTRLSSSAAVSRRIARRSV
jgi:hypothetical protein